MVATIAAGTSASYYTNQTEYYLGSREPKGLWSLVGPGLGLQQGTLVEADVFKNLHEGLDASGRRLPLSKGRWADRVAAYDATFSMSKSASILWAIGDPDLRAAIEVLHQRAVDGAVELLNMEAAFCRRGKGGHHLEPVKLTVATFAHGESRPALHADGQRFSDPQHHIHACVLAVAQRADGTMGAIDGRALFAHKMALGARYHLLLSIEFQKLGFAIESTGKNGIFEISGVPKDLCGYFAARRHEIEAELLKEGVSASADAPALAAAKAKVTRAAKEQVSSGNDRHAFWCRATEAQDFKPEQVVAAAREMGRLAKASEKLDQAELGRRILAATEGLTQTASVFERRQLLAAGYSACVGTGISPDVVDTEIERLQRVGEIVEIGRNQKTGRMLYSTRAIVELERDLQRLTIALGGDRAANHPAANRVSELIASANLNDGQAGGARVATNDSVVSVIGGGPGVGKTHLLRVATAAWQERGWRVIGAATSWKVAHSLRDELGIEANAIDSWLARGPNRPFLTDRTVLLIDEAGLVSSRQMHRIMREVAAARERGADVVLRLVGDLRQLQPIGGPGLKIVVDVLGAQRVDQIVRQKEAWARETVAHFGAGEASEGLALLEERGAVQTCDSAKSVTASIISAWKQQRAALGHAPLLIAKTNVKVRALNLAARQTLRDEGAIAATDDIVLSAANTSGYAHELPIAVGDRVKFLIKNDSLGVINGTEASISSINRFGAEPVLIARVGEREITFKPSDISDEKGRARLSHAYATTVYGAQGLTTDVALVWADVSMDQHDVFVAASRARVTTRLFVDKSELEVRAKSARALNDRARPVQDSELRDVLVAAFSRTNVRQSTLGVDPGAGVEATQHRAETVQQTRPPNAVAPRTRTNERVQSQDRHLGSTKRARSKLRGITLD